MMYWLFAAVTFFSALLATFIGDTRKAVLALWTCGLSASGLFLVLGAEFLAVVQAVVSTLSALALSIYAVNFGEYGEKPAHQDRRPAARVVLPVFAGLSLAAILWLGFRRMPGALAFEARVLSDSEKDLAGVARLLVSEHLISVEVLAVTLFLAIVGAGVIARAEATEPPGPQEAHEAHEPRPGGGLL